MKVKSFIKLAGCENVTSMLQQRGRTTNGGIGPVADQICDHGIVIFCCFTYLNREKL